MHHSPDFCLVDLFIRLRHAQSPQNTAKTEPDKAREHERPYQRRSANGRPLAAATMYVVSIWRFPSIWQNDSPTGCTLAKPLVRRADLHPAG